MPVSVAWGSQGPQRRGRRRAHRDSINPRRGRWPTLEISQSLVASPHRSCMHSACVCQCVRASLCLINAFAPAGAMGVRGATAGSRATAVTTVTGASPGHPAGGIRPWCHSMLGVSTWLTSHRHSPQQRRAFRHAARPLILAREVTVAAGLATQPDRSGAAWEGVVDWHSAGDAAE